MVSNTVQKSDSTLAVLAWLYALLDSLKRNEKTILLAGVAFQIVILLAMIMTPLTTVIYGDTILLRVEPVDPRDLFRGDYVILTYEFSRVPPQEIPGLELSDFQGQPIFVEIVPDEDGKHWRASQFSLQRPSNAKFLRGRLAGWGRIEFGIESYFVQEGEGLRYENAVRNGRLSAEVSLDGNGKAVLRRLLVD